MKFQALVAEIIQLHEVSEKSAAQALQRVLAVRNWMIGAYIVAFEQEGEDRAGYGARLLDELADALSAVSSEGLSARNLRNFRARFYGRLLALHGLVWGGLGAAALKFGGSGGQNWHWRLGRLDHLLLRLGHALFFRALHPVIPAPEFADSPPGGESAEVEARCYTPARKK